MRLHDLLYYRWWTPPSRTKCRFGNVKERKGHSLECNGIAIFDDRPPDSFGFEWSLDFVSGDDGYHLEEIKCGPGPQSGPKSLRIQQSGFWPRIFFNGINPVHIDDCFLSLRIGGYLIDCWQFQCPSCLASKTKESVFYLYYNDSIRMAIENEGEYKTTVSPHGFNIQGNFPKIRNQKKELITSPAVKRPFTVRLYIQSNYIVPATKIFQENYREFFLSLVRNQKRKNAPV